MFRHVAGFGIPYSYEDSNHKVIAKLETPFAGNYTSIFLITMNKYINIHSLLKILQFIFFSDSKCLIKTFFIFRSNSLSYPLSLFTYSTMRKNIKWRLYDEFSTVDKYEFSHTEAFDIGGGDP